MGKTINYLVVSVSLFCDIKVLILRINWSDKLAACILSQNFDAKKRPGPTYVWLGCVFVNAPEQSIVQ
ncbi:hypothetical protein PSEEN3676 [Pseudomonas entomophila L48]|uniref:Uncharacterized protein n=1 Tax=Pseudomonas entomophila (strain L48) TaxID=384676 RepID=Q1I7H8_PSEE4|nr:hypothetical protein PSEEN3676 [Pseudomonas entomophila L48]